jgi:hypothetical protein
MLRGKGKLKPSLIIVACIFSSIILSFFTLKVESEISTITLYAHSETTTINDVNYYLQKTEPADGPPTILSTPADTAGRKLMGRWIYPLNEIASIQPSTWTVTYRIMKSLCASSLIAHGNIDILIRKSDNAIRTTIATNVANSPTITQVNTWETLTATYNWPGYTVTDQTDYLEVAYYIEVTTPQSSKEVSLLFDDPSLPLTDQTKIQNIIITHIIKNFLTVKTDPEGVTTILGEGWYDQNTTVNLTAPDNINISTGVRYKFTQWSVDGVSQGIGVNPINVVMDTNHTATAHYTLQYYLTVSSLYGATGGEGWYDSGATAYATLDTGIFDQGNKTRRVFTNWSGDTSGINYTQSNPIIMDGPKNAMANWKTQYLLTVQTNPLGLTPQPTRNPSGEAGPANSWWYDTSTSVTLTAQAVTQYTFTYWDVDGASQSSGVNPITVNMNAPHTATAYYTPVPPPSVSINPLNASIQLGQSLSFTSTVSGGTAPYRYQWYVNSNPVSGATSPSWTFTPTASGIYYVQLKVTDAVGNTAQSETAKIIVITVPVGGYSISVAKGTTTSEIAAYTILIALFAAALSLTKQKENKQFHTLFRIYHLSVFKLTKSENKP